MVESNIWAGIFGRVRTVLADTLQVAPDLITPAASLQRDLDADSLDMIELTIALGREFEAETLKCTNLSCAATLEIRIRQITTVGQIVECLEDIVICHC